MTVLKKIGIILGILLLLFLILGLVMPKDITVTYTRFIYFPATYLYNLSKNMKVSIECDSFNADEPTRTLSPAHTNPSAD